MTSQATLNSMFVRYLEPTKQEKTKWSGVEQPPTEFDRLAAAMHRSAAEARKQEFERRNSNDYDGSWAASPRKFGRSFL